MADDFSERYGDLLTGSYDCVDRIVLNACFSLGHNPGGFRCWWRRLHDDCDEQLGNTRLMRFAGRFARRLKAWGNANGVPVIYCKAGERKHLIAEEYLAAHEVGTGVFLVLAAKAPASVWQVSRSESSGLISNIAKKPAYVNHYSFHIMDPQWGHVTIKMSGHPPFPAQVILNGPRVRRGRGPGGGDRVRQGGQLFYWHRGSAGPGPGRRYLVAGCGYRAPGPGLRPVDLPGVPVLRPGPRRPGPQRVPLQLLHLPG